MAAGRLRISAVWVLVFFLISVMLVFATLRISIDSANLAEGVVPGEDSFDRRYTLMPVLAYAHILPGVIYLCGAPFQLSRRFRNRHLALHRKMGRVLLTAGLISGVFALLFGALHAFGGFLEASAAVVFALYFLLALSTAFRAVRAGDIVRHRRWMIRAFAIGLAVGTIRIWIGLFQAFELLSFQDAFGPAFWISFLLHATAAEVWLRWRPAPREY
ncbi:MAG: DUF2306 domain-containing protein [Actinomycetota bacterium]|nr:DUF2306 domain-containing protein [Actinomycetota bacterium]